MWKNWTKNGNKHVKLEQDYKWLLFCIFSFLFVFMEFLACLCVWERFFAVNSLTSFKWHFQLLEKRLCVPFQCISDGMFQENNQSQEHWSWKGERKIWIAILCAQIIYLQPSVAAFCSHTHNTRQQQVEPKFAKYTTTKKKKR